MAAILRGNFACLYAGRKCLSRLQTAYERYGFSCANSRLVKRPKHKPPKVVTVTEPAPAPPAPVSTAPMVSDAFVNTDPNDLTTHDASFHFLSAPPVLHVIFATPIIGTHDLSVTFWNFGVGVGRTLTSTLQAGWTSFYMGFPGAASNYYLGAYQVTVSIDGTTDAQFSYTITN